MHTQKKEKKKYWACAMWSNTSTSQFAFGNETNKERYWRALCDKDGCPGCFQWKASQHLWWNGGAHGTGDFQSTIDADSISGTLKNEH